MKAFYIIHISVILEIILSILITIKLSEFILRIKNLGIKIEQNSELKLAEIKKIREKIQNFNQKFSKTATYTFDLGKKLIANFAIQGFIKKFILPKNDFLKKISSYQTVIFWFIVTFFFFNKKMSESHKNLI